MNHWAPRLDLTRVRSAGNPARLALARTLAWALLVAAWLVLGAAGHQHLRLWAGGLGPLALWLAAAAALHASLRQRRLSMGALRAALLLGTAVAGLAGAALGVADRPPWASPVALLAAALGLAVVQVAAALTVQTLRRRLAARPAAPLWPACAGAALGWAATAWVVQADAHIGWGSPLTSASLLLLCAAALAALLPRQAPPVGGCRSDLFDCALPWPAAAAWRHGADWPLLSARLAMLPMMASLPAMADWCRSGPGLSPELSVLAHLGAMVLPACVVRRWLANASLAERRHAVLALMLSSGVALLAWPGLNGLMAAAMLQGTAWSLAWAGPLLGRASEAAGPGGHPTPGPTRLSSAQGPGQWLLSGHHPRQLAALVAAAAPATALLGLGLLIHHQGPQGLAGLHAALVVTAAVGPLAGAVWGALVGKAPGSPGRVNPV